MLHCIPLNKDITCHFSKWSLISDLGTTDNGIAPSKVDALQDQLLKCIECAWLLEGEPGECVQVRQGKGDLELPPRPVGCVGSCFNSRPVFSFINGVQLCYFPSTAVRGK